MQEVELLTFAVRKKWVVACLYKVKLRGLFQWQSIMETIWYNITQLLFVDKDLSQLHGHVFQRYKIKRCNSLLTCELFIWTA